MDIYFLFFASFGVIVFGLSKGGFPGPISMLAVPIMSFAMSPLKAAGILLPLLLVMDLIALYLYWNKWDLKLLKIIIPSSIIGIVIGSITFQYTSEKLSKRWAVLRAFLGGLRGIVRLHSRGSGGGAVRACPGRFPF